MIELAGSAAHVVVADVGIPVLEDADQRHLARVLRLRQGEAVTATDGAGRYRWYRWTGEGLEPDGEVLVAPPPSSELAIGFGLVKGDKADLIVQKLTEVGVDRIVPVACQRSVVRWDTDKAALQVQRWRRIAREAAMQSRRVWLPAVDEVVSVASALGSPVARRADMEGRWWDDEPDVHQRLVVVGPEGGWSESERALPAPALRVSEQVLRSETAAVAVATLLADARRRARS